MNYSYVMGIDESIETLSEHGFDIIKDGENYITVFSNDKCTIWEEFVCNHLELNYWNEYFTDKSVVFIFKLIEGIRRYEVFDFSNDEVLKLCEQLCECKFTSIYDMLKGNSFYAQLLEN